MTSDPMPMALVVNVALEAELLIATRGSEVWIPVWSAKLTEPVGTPAPGVELLTVAVKVMEAPAIAGLLDDVRAVEVGSKPLLDAVMV